MTKAIVVAGATGNLGGRIVRALMAEGAEVRAMVRRGTAEERVSGLKGLGVEVVEADLTRAAEVRVACAGAGCMVSALLGLREVMVDMQSAVLEGAIKAGVERFIPSDYAMDFTKLTPGGNRNLDLHREFAARVDASGVRASSVLNGMFTELLTGEAPFILPKLKRVLCWGNPDQKMDFTTMDNTAAFTARVAMDDGAPRWLRVAGDQLSARGLAEVAGEVAGERYKVLRPGGLGLFGTMIKVARMVQPARGEAFPAWQGMQYMRDMYEGKALMTGLDNERYAGMRWTRVREVLEAAAGKGIGQK